MAKAAKHQCVQCSKDHHGFGAVCWRCERQNAKDAKAPMVCPYCHKETEKRTSRYHPGCVNCSTKKSWRRSRTARTAGAGSWCGRLGCR